MVYRPCQSTYLAKERTSRSVCTFVCRSTCLPVRLSVCLSVRPSVCLSFTHWPLNLSMSYQSISLHTYPFVRVTVCLFLCLYTRDDFFFISRSIVFFFYLKLQVDVSNPDDRKINFGALRVGQSAERVVKLRNSSAAAITFSLVITPSLPLLQQTNVLTVKPATEITLQPNGGSCNVHIAFAPVTRIPQFTEEVRCGKSVSLKIGKIWNQCCWNQLFFHTNNILYHF